MKYATAAIILIFWMVFTILLAVSFIGLVVLIDEDAGWSKIPRDLLKVFN